MLRAVGSAPPSFLGAAFLVATIFVLGASVFKLPPRGCAARSSETVGRTVPVSPSLLVGELAQVSDLTRHCLARDTSDTWKQPSRKASESPMLWTSRGCTTGAISARRMSDSDEKSRDWSHGGRGHHFPMSRLPRMEARLHVSHVCSWPLRTDQPETGFHVRCRSDSWPSVEVVRCWVGRYVIYPIPFRSPTRHQPKTSRL